MVGQSIANKFISSGWRVCLVSRSGRLDSQTPVVAWDLAQKLIIPKEIKEFGRFDAVCWAQGLNLNDSIYAFDSDDHLNVYQVNVLYILRSLSQIIGSDLLNHPARLCIISSIWQNISRNNKLSYSISKAALQGLVLSLANDMSKDGDLINAILPGALDTPMTRANLSSEQIKSIENATGFKRLPKLDDIGNAALFLCSAENASITGQFIKVDLGFSDVRNL